MKTFSFGRNWKNFVKNTVNLQVVEEAKQSLLRYLPEEFYKNKTFIDVGCGSGLFSLSAILLGANKVISFDIDPESVEATKLLKKKFANLIPSNVDWEIFTGNTLDKNLVNKLAEQGDIVYSWGVLHHTGDMYNAIKNTTKLVKKDGFLIIAIYNYAPSSNFWLKIKEFYNSHTWLQPILNIIYGTFVSLGYMLKKRTLNLRKKEECMYFMTL